MTRSLPNPTSLNSGGPNSSKSSLVPSIFQQCPPNAISDPHQMYCRFENTCRIWRNLRLFCQVAEFRCYLHRSFACIRLSLCLATQGAIAARFVPRIHDLIHRRGDAPTRRRSPREALESTSCWKTCHIEGLTPGRVSSASSGFTMSQAVDSFAVAKVVGARSSHGSSGSFARLLDQPGLARMDSLTVATRVNVLTA